MIGARPWTGAAAARQVRLMLLPRLDRSSEFTVHLACVALFGWLLTAVFTNAIGRVPYLSDFRHFYTQAAVSKDGHYTALVSARELEVEQVARLSTPGLFPTVYGPQVGVALIPIAYLPFLPAYGVWQLLVVGATVVTTLWLAGSVPALRPWRGRILVLTLLAPPLFHAAIAGHLSPVALFALTALVKAQERQSRVLSGVAVGLLGYKVSLVAPAVAVCLVAGEWTVALVAMAVAAGQLLVVAPVVGLDVVQQHVWNVLAAARSPDAVAVKPQYMASLRTFWSALLPAGAALAAYGVTAAGAVAAAGWAWRRTKVPLERAAFLGLAIALAAPHLYIYDLLVLAPALMVTGALVVQRPEQARRYRWWLAGAFASPLLAPLTTVTHVQLLTLVLAGWMVGLIAVAAAAGALTSSHVEQAR
jgi:hypothetical protein